MFFSTYVLTKKGPLAKIWLAAHWDKKLTRNDVRVIDLNQTIVQIVHPAVPIALRTSGELLIGVVRIYALKVKHLLKDATDATLLLRAQNIQVVKGVPVSGGLQLAKEGKDSAVTITMDLVAAHHAGGVEKLVDANFDDIADILAGGADSKRHTKNSMVSDERVVGSAWFTAEPSQFVEEFLNSQGAGDAELARIRADLLAFGENEERRTESSHSKKSSLSSIEKGRASAGGAGVAAALADAMDIGVPAPDLDMPFPGMNENVEHLLGGVVPEGVEDMFAMPMEPAAAVAAAAAASSTVPTAKKIKPVNILDANETAFSTAEVEKFRKDRHDLINAERRHGPLDPQEEKDRNTLRAAENGASVLSLEPLSDLPNNTLRLLYQSLLRSSVENLIEAARASQGGDLDPSKAMIPLLPDDGGLGALPLEENAAAFEYQPAEAAAVNEPMEGGRPSYGRKRGRDQDAAFSASALATLDKIRTLFKSSGRSASTSFHSSLAKGMRRVEAARTFVDILSLASHGIIGVKQTHPYGEIQITRTDLTDKDLRSTVAVA